VRGTRVFAAANAEIVVVVNAGNAAASLTAEQVADVFLGKSNAFMPVDPAIRKASAIWRRARSMGQ
jgi:ABC-type phosphate transport system substrate-binding protein